MGGNGSLSGVRRRPGERGRAPIPRMGNLTQRMPGVRGRSNSGGFARPTTPSRARNSNTNRRTNINGR